MENSELKSSKTLMFIGAILGIAGSLPGIILFLTNQNYMLSGVLKIVGLFGLVGVILSVILLLNSRKSNESFLESMSKGFSLFSCIYILIFGWFIGGIVMIIGRNKAVRLIKINGGNAVTTGGVTGKAFGAYKQYRVAKDGYIDKNSKLGMMMQGQNFTENISNARKRHEVNKKVASGEAHELDKWIQDIVTALNGYAAMALQRNDNTLRENLLTLQHDFEGLWASVQITGATEDGNIFSQGIQVFFGQLQIVLSYCEGNLNYNTMRNTRELYSQVSQLLNRIQENLPPILENTDYLVEWLQSQGK